MKRTTVWLVAVMGMALLALSGCSSSKKAETAASQDEIPTLDAGTDALPAEPPASPATSPEFTPQAENAVTPETPVAPDAKVAEATPAEPQAPAEPAQPEAPVAEVAPVAPPAPAEPAVTPLASPVTPPVASSAGESDHYTVQPGDTLMRIAFETYGDLYQWKKVYEMNRDQLPAPSALKKGMVLKIEKPAVPVTIERNGEKYLIKLGDTLGKISDDVYGTPKKWRKLYENNKQMIRDPNRIFAGFFLYYTITEQEKQEADRLKMSRQRTPIANGDSAGGGIRMPSSNQ